MSQQTEQPEKTTLTVTIDGRAIEAHPGELLIAAAERHGTYIPRFCYHPRMREVGMCRMCIVEIDSGRGPALLPACMAPVGEGMTVDTQSARVKKAQDGVLEFLLINHPLDCPVCDKGGECPLQDQTLAFGPGETRFVEEKRHFEKPIPISDLVYLDRERCILCDRCTRFAAEVAGDPLISFIDRGNHTQVNTFPDDPFASYFSGNTVQICPVGALLARPYRFRARPWDLDQVESTCTACSVGCRIAVQSSSNRLVRKLGVDVDPVNWGWLCDKGRFDFEAVGSDDRLGAPLVRAPGAEDLAEASWSQALAAAAEGITRARIRRGPESIAVLGGARGTNEDAYAWSKLARTLLGTDSVDAQMGDGLPAQAVVGLPRATIDAACAADTILLLGPDLKEELPVLYLRLRQAVVERGATLVELSPVETGMTRYATVSLRYRPGEVAALARALADESAPAGAGERPGGLAPAEAVAQAAQLLRRGSLVCVLGRPSLAEAAQSVVDAAGALLAGLPDTTFLPALRRGNVAGALDMGLAPGLLPGRVTLDEGRPWFARQWEAIPAGPGLDAHGIITAAAEGRVGCLILVGADPLADFPDRELARRAMAGAGFVIAVDCFLTESSRRADVVLPAAAFGEKAGTTTNIEGRVSRLHQKVTAPGTARADWMIAAELAFRLGGDLGFDSVEGVWDEIERLAPAHRGLTAARLSSPEGFDGIVAGAARDAETTGGPPSMAQTDSPGIQGALAHTKVDTLASSAMGTSDKPDPTEGLALQPPDPSGGGAEGTATVAGRPAILQWSAPGPGAANPPPLDRYSLRLVVSRRLYDTGTFVHHSPSLAPLAPGARLRVNPADLTPLGVASGARLQVSSGRGRVVLEALADPGVPQGSVALSWNQPGPGAGELIDATQPVTEVRLETLSASAPGGKATP